MSILELNYTIFPASLPSTLFVNWHHPPTWSPHFYSFALVAPSNSIQQAVLICRLNQGELEREHGRVWREEREGRNDIIITSKRSTMNPVKSLQWLPSLLRMRFNSLPWPQSPSIWFVVYPTSYL